MLRSIESNYFHHQLRAIMTYLLSNYLLLHISLIIHLAHFKHAVLPLVLLFTIYLHEKMGISISAKGIGVVILLDFKLLKGLRIDRQNYNNWQFSIPLMQGLCTVVA